MPLYEYRCEECDKNWDSMNSIKNMYKEHCDCGELATIVINPTKTPPVVYNYYSEALGAHITSPSQKKRIMKERGVEESG